VLRALSFHEIPVSSGQQPKPQIVFAVLDFYIRFGTACVTMRFYAISQKLQEFISEICDTSFVIAEDKKGRPTFIRRPS